MPVALAGSATNTAASDTTINVTYSVASAGNCLIASVMSFSGITTVTVGGSSDNWGPVVSQIATAPPFEQCAIWTDAGCSGGLSTVAVTFAASTHAAVQLWEFSGVLGASPVDQVNQAPGSGGGTFSSGSVSPTQPGELIIGAVAAGGPSTTPVITGPGSPWVLGSQLNPSGVAASFLGGYLIEGSASQVAQTFSGSFNSNFGWAAVAVSLFAAGALPRPLIASQAVRRAAFY